jgi:hypothetical protein
MRKQPLMGVLLAVPEEVQLELTRLAVAVVLEPVAELAELAVELAELAELAAWAVLAELAELAQLAELATVAVHKIQSHYKPKDLPYLTPSFFFVQQSQNLF